MSFPAILPENLTDQANKYKLEPNQVIAEITHPDDREPVTWKYVALSNLLQSLEIIPVNNCCLFQLYVLLGGEDVFSISINVFFIIKKWEGRGAGEVTKMN